MHGVVSSLWELVSCVRVFFFQAEGGIRDRDVTGVQTCALPICCLDRWPSDSCSSVNRLSKSPTATDPSSHAINTYRDCISKIGRASCRERVQSPGAVTSLYGKHTPYSMEHVLHAVHTIRYTVQD